MILPINAYQFVAQNSTALFACMQNYFDQSEDATSSLELIEGLQVATLSVLSATLITGVVELSSKRISKVVNLRSACGISTLFKVSYFALTRLAWLSLPGLAATFSYFASWPTQDQVDQLFYHYEDCMGAGMSGCDLAHLAEDSFCSVPAGVSCTPASCFAIWMVGEAQNFSRLHFNPAATLTPVITFTMAYAAMVAWRPFSNWSSSPSEPIIEEDDTTTLEIGEALAFTAPVLVPLELQQLQQAQIGLTPVQLDSEDEWEGVDGQGCVTMVDFFRWSGIFVLPMLASVSFFMCVSGYHRASHPFLLGRRVLVECQSNCLWANSLPWVSW